MVKNKDLNLWLKKVHYEARVFKVDRYDTCCLDKLYNNLIKEIILFGQKNIVGHLWAIYGHLLLCTPNHGLGPASLVGLKKSCF